MKFSTIVLAVATTLVIFILFYSVLSLTVMSVISYLPVSYAGILFIISMLVAGLLVGYIFALSIQEESKIKSVGKISILVATTVLLIVATTFSGNTYYGDRSKVDLQNRFATDAWTTTDWFVYEQMMIFVNVAFHVAVTLAFSFIGLYSGATLRKHRTK